MKVIKIMFFFCLVTMLNKVHCTILNIWTDQKDINLMYLTESMYDWQKAMGPFYKQAFFVPINTKTKFDLTSTSFPISYRSSYGDVHIHNSRIYGDPLEGMNDPKQEMNVAITSCEGKYYSCKIRYCPVGKIAVEGTYGDYSCTNCPTGFIPSDDLKTCVCPKDKYLSGTTCMACPTGASLPVGSTSVAACQCPAGQLMTTKGCKAPTLGKITGTMVNNIFDTSSSKFDVSYPSAPVLNFYYTYADGVPGSNVIGGFLTGSDGTAKAFGKDGKSNHFPPNSDGKKTYVSANIFLNATNDRIVGSQFITSNPTNTNPADLSNKGAVRGTQTTNYKQLFCPNYAAPLGVYGTYDSTSITSIGLHCP